ncbi:hypothetical protein COW36_03390 [bacterium (Candidatus Blackallbacteria) CG17_big_fil_post_rev_8_21_14_2_50_48_46]|uniref:Lipoprotein SmpA/OmlA domain-containing protein n=1 Tax=bacterium (Candidatus Blackallbacteria) CG17_big_fil_post_rev_8_21_14_2_50_48_46 TaxID=2014261 RepID=A0A2M7G9P0_9BACT|nr:MAG: hypothetical protein COW64_05630 [bacterium (Candidatus Blackallbacteria) CG18_big_fil_WC_8_21_14_2_50_49_26]PIW18833.1 MAG: hypothetical protein COW36_03390 [bacterium (Candidatus Blackallbacteria) CG17_big_fil_post_rev_8_21_14_2_50_48_46]PIW49288.1 MAG: hypothetical protein COW20_06540 [bacterium (Candidatus Blackallbacteria) CG13_big_fil_rev_8_21_14_2_50_49_14]
MKKFLFCSLLLGLNACAAAEPRKFTIEEGERLRRVSVLKQEPKNLSLCQYIGPIEAIDGEDQAWSFFRRWGSFEQAMYLLQLEAANRGGNLVIMDSEQPSYSRSKTNFQVYYILRGRIFACSNNSNGQ